MYGSSRLLTRACDLQKNKTLLNFYIYNIWKVNSFLQVSLVFAVNTARELRAVLEALSQIKIILIFQILKTHTQIYVCEYVYIYYGALPFWDTPIYKYEYKHAYIGFVHIYIHIHVDSQKPYILFYLFLYIHIYIKINKYTFSKTHMVHATHMQQKAAYTETSDKRKWGYICENCFFQ